MVTLTSTDGGMSVTVTIVTDLFLRSSMADGMRGKRWLRKGMTLRMAIAVKDGNGEESVFVLHGPTTAMKRRVFNQLRGVMMKDYSFSKVRMVDIINGRCPDHWEVTVTKPDFHLAAPLEWCRLIAKLLSRCVRCDVKICKNYEQFLNL